MRNACDSDSRCGLACDASARDAKSLAMRVERCEPGNKPCPAPSNVHFLCQIFHPTASTQPLPTLFSNPARKLKFAQKNVEKTPTRFQNTSAPEAGISQKRFSRRTKCRLRNFSFLTLCEETRASDKSSTFWLIELQREHPIRDSKDSIGFSFFVYSSALHFQERRALRYTGRHRAPNTLLRQTPWS